MELTYKKALEYLRRAIKEKGAEYVYELDGITPNRYREENGHNMTCEYFHNDQPSCIVGHVMSYMGYGHAEEGISATQALNSLGIEYDVNSGVLLDRVQEKQDTGYPWGEALELALESMEEM